MGLQPFNQLTIEAIGDNLSSSLSRAEADLDGGAGKFGQDFYEVSIQGKTTSTMVHNVYLILGNTSVLGLTPTDSNLRSLHGGDSQVIPILLSGIPGEELAQNRVVNIRKGLTFRYVSVIMRQGFTDDLWLLLSFSNVKEPDVAFTYQQMISVA